MSKPFKNILQEFCQKNKLEFPLYSSYPTNQGWKASVKLLNRETFSDVNPKKVDSESQAAERMLIAMNINEFEVSPVPFVNQPFPKYLHVIDGENINITAPEQTSDTSWFIFFYKNHGKASRSFPVEKILVKSSRPDGVDSYIQLFVGVEIQKNPHLEMVYIHTRDKFGHSLADAIEDISQGRVKAEVV